jgi:hypothetical protein
VKRALSAIAADEARHAELAWRTLAWAVRAGGAEVVAALVESLPARLGDAAVDSSTAAYGGQLEAHGVLDGATARRVSRATLAEVVGPALRALIGSAAEPRNRETARAAVKISSATRADALPV